MTIPKDHVHGNCVNECHCEACVQVFLWIGHVAEYLERRHRCATAAELQNRLEPIVRVASNNGAEAVQILREDGSVGLRAPLDDEASVKRIIRIRLFDMCASIGQRKEHSTREALIEEAVKSDEAEDPSLREERRVLELEVRGALDRLDPLGRQIVWLRKVEGKTRREVEESLSLTPKAVRYREDRAVRRLRSSLSQAQSALAC